MPNLSNQHGARTSLIPSTCLEFDSLHQIQFSFTIVISNTSNSVAQLKKCEVRSNFTLFHEAVKEVLDK
jgi:hypothetical protein